MLMPSSPQADELLSPKTTARRSGNDTDASTSAQAPTRGNRQGVVGGSPDARTSPAARGPTLTKYSFKWSADVLGAARDPGLPPTQGRIMRHVPPRPLSRMRSSTSSRLSRRIAPRTALFALRYPLEPCPYCASPPPTPLRRHKILSGVGLKRGAGVPNLNGSDGAWTFKTGKKVAKNLLHLSVIGVEKAASQSEYARSKFRKVKSVCAK